MFPFLIFFQNNYTTPTWDAWFRICSRIIRLYTTPLYLCGNVLFCVLFPVCVFLFAEFRFGFMFASRYSIGREQGGV